MPNRGDWGAISDNGGSVVLEEALRWPPGLSCGSWFMTDSILACEYLFAFASPSFWGCFCWTGGVAAEEVPA